MKNRILSLLCIAGLLCAIPACREGGEVTDITEPTGDTTAETPTEVTGATPADTTDVTGGATPIEPYRPDLTVVPPEKQKIKLNTDLLDEFGMTFGELEKKYGEAVSAKPAGKDYEYVDANGNKQNFVNSQYTFFFEKGGRGYTFSISDSNENRKLSDGTRVPKANELYQETGDLQVKDLLLGMEKAMTIEDFMKAIGHRGEFNATPVPTADEPWAYLPFNPEIFPYRTSFWYNNEIIYHYRIEHAKEGIIEPESHLKVFCQ